MPPKKKQMNRLERDTAAYFDNMTEENLKEENELAKALAGAAKGIDFDNEP
jgi:hypothetical protein